jgi:hypothetical protein
MVMVIGMERKSLRSLLLNGSEPDEPGDVKDLERSE